MPRRLDVGAVAAELGEADVVEDDEDDIRHALGGVGTGGHQGSESRQSLPILPPELDSAHGTTP